MLFFVEFVDPGYFIFLQHLASYGGNVLNTMIEQFFYVFCYGRVNSLVMGSFLLPDSGDAGFVSCSLKQNRPHSSVRHQSLIFNTEYRF